MVDNKKRLYWILQTSVWSAYAGVQIVVSILASGQPISVNRTIFFICEAALFFLATHLFRLYVKRRNWLRLKVPKLIPRVLLASALMALAVYLFRVPLSLITGRSAVFESSFLPDQIVGFSAIYMLFFFLWATFYFTYHFIEKYNKSLKYEAYMTSIELNNLKSQLNPHFIFNALNSIRALVDENPEKSKQAINQLSNILRNSLTFEKKRLTKFEDELKMVKDYLSLESVRFEERLKTEFNIHPQSANFRVPPLMIQTLVENGVKHGISKLTAGGVIQLKTMVENNRLKIQIRNSGQLLNGIRKSKGIGIPNTVQRLKLLYGDQAAFRMVNENNNFVLTEIVIPQTLVTT